MKEIGSFLSKRCIHKQNDDEGIDKNHKDNLASLLWVEWGDVKVVDGWVVRLFKEEKKLVCLWTSFTVIAIYVSRLTDSLSLYIEAWERVRSWWNYQARK